MTIPKTTAKPAKAPKTANKPADEAPQAPAATIDPAVQADQAAQAPALDTPTDTAPNGPTADYAYAEGFTLDENGDVVGADGVALPPVFLGEGNAAMVLQALVLACRPALGELAATDTGDAEVQRARSAVETLNVTLDGAAAAQAVEKAVSEMMSQAFADVVVERKRQVEAKGYSEARDDAYTSYELTRAAGCYALNAGGVPRHRSVMYWPFEPSAFKSKGYRADLVKAAALLLAEIERIDRADGAE